MVKTRRILSIIVLVFIFAAYGSSVLAIGKSCTVNGTECSINDEQCCCCFVDGTCHENDINTVQIATKGVCFPVSVKCKDVVCPLSTHTSITEFINSAVNYILYVSLILAPLMIVLGAFYYLTSAGDPKKAKTGSAIIQWTAVGLAIILFAKGITAIVKMILVG